MLSDAQYMAQALRLAERGLYTTTPNPRVGCVVVNDNALVGEGFHARAGEPHAEVLALRAAGDRARGGYLYVNLEPCAHHGRTPPCIDAIKQAGVKRVVAAMRDPNPLVDGQGAAALRAAGIEVEFGVMEQEARQLNIGFISRMQRGRPWVRCKVAATLDGRTALANGRSQWITGEEARADGHHYRARSCAVMTGVGTLKEDDPQLTVRAVATTRQPLKVLVDSRLNAPPQAKLFDAGNALVFAAQHDEAKIARLRERGAEVVLLSDAGGKVDLVAMMQELGRRGMNEVLLETGVKLNGSLLRAGVVDEIIFYLAPKLFGDSARGMFNLPELRELNEAHTLQIDDVRMIGADLRVIARVTGTRNV